MTHVLTCRTFVLGLTALTGSLGFSIGWAREGGSAAVRLGLRVGFEADGTLVVATGKSEMG